MDFEKDMPEIDAPTEKASADDLSFKDAFAIARKAGSKTFTWRGKKYTTELASEKKPAKEKMEEVTVSASRLPPAKAGPSTRGGERKWTKEGREADAQRIMRDTKGGYGMPGRIPSGDKVLSNLASREAGRRESERKARNRLLGKPDMEVMKRGGSVKASSASRRADGIAQRGKTRGRMY